jgi:uncharacterized protein YndB with AHSA1/START domain
MEDTKDREVITTRIIEASPERVWRAWTDPNEVGLWWGPAGFTTTTEHIDVRPGGEWRFVMHGPDGTDYPNAYTFNELEKPTRIACWHHESKEFGMEGWQMTLTFEAVGDKTRVTMAAVYANTDEYDKHVKGFKAREGAEQMLGRLETFVKKSNWTDRTGTRG